MNSPQRGSPDPRTGPAREPGVVWVCQSCDHTWEPSPADLAGEPPPCPHCDGWTAIGELAEPDSRPQTAARGLAHHSIEAPGWNYIGGQVWRQRLLRDVAAMVRKTATTPPS